MTAPARDLSRPKAKQLLAGAREVFLADGFEAASVDAIARKAGVSKATVYSYFPDKRALFAAVVETECRRQAVTIVDAYADTGDVHASLLAMARAYIGFITSPFAQAIYRVVVAESPRFPDLGRTFYESGPQLGAERLKAFLAHANAEGTLAVADLELAAHQFIALCRAERFDQCLFGIASPPDAAEIERLAAGAVTTFLARYARDGP